MTENYLNILAETIRNNWDQPALTDFYLTEDGSAQDTSRGNHYTYGEMYAELCRVANLLTSLGLKKGDHIAICGANSAHWVIAYLAIAKMQGVSVIVMHTLMPDEIARLVAFSNAKALFTDEDLWSELKSQSVPQVGSVISLEDWNVLFGKKQIINHKFEIINRECEFDPVPPDSLAMICFTSGTSGSAKGVMLSFRNISFCVSSVGNTFHACNNRHAVAILPLSHSFSLGYALVALVDSANVFIPIIDKNLTGIITSIKIIQPYALGIIPQFLSVFLSCDDNKDYAFLDDIIVGGASLSLHSVKMLRAKGFPITCGYGTTESTASISMVVHSQYRVGSSGKICDALSCRISPEGEILVKGENVMLGYYKDPEATASKIDSDGWLHTGDKGYLDEDGYLYVEGRLEQDIIVLPNGENIRPDNIESLINALPEVSESIVLARDGKLVAIVVPSSESSESRETSETSETRASSPSSSLRRKILRVVNPQLPLFSQLYDVEITDQPLARTEKQTLKRYLYK